MIKFFRRIRQTLLTENKFSKYILYAFGEIILVMIGILLALQVNNWNEKRKENLKLMQYRTKLIVELNTDLENLNYLDQDRNDYKKTIMNYLNYYNSENINMEILIQKKDSIDYIINSFSKSSFTLDELSSTGNITSFSEEEKNAIAELKSMHSIYKYYERETLKDVANSWIETEKHTDKLFDDGYSKKQHVSIKDWQNNLDSEQYRTFHNELSSALDLYDYQENVVYPNIRYYTKALLEVLQSKIKNND